MPRFYREDHPHKNNAGPMSGAGVGYSCCRRYWITRVTLVEWLVAPLVPVMVRVRVPRVALSLTLTDSVDVPEPVTEGGVKVGVTRAPCPVTLRLTVPVNPFTAPIVTVY